MHNGFITDFEKCRTSIIEKISAKYISHIKGETDSEVLFFLFLTIRDSVMSTAEIAKDVLLMKTMKKMVSGLKRMRIEFFANIVYSDKTHAVITRYSYNTGNIPNLSLYWNIIPDGIIVSSEPVGDSYKEIRENSIHVLDITG
jgi:predicted glutamine amidotransferase